jgi:hypothetical protein
MVQNGQKWKEMGLDIPRLRYLSKCCLNCVVPRGGVFRRRYGVYLDTLDDPSNKAHTRSSFEIFSFLISRRLLLIILISRQVHFHHA